MLQKIRAALIERSLAEKRDFFPQFFKAFPGGYGQGDLFLGVRVPDIRLVARTFEPSVDLLSLENLIKSPYHEERFVALEILLKRCKPKRLELEKRRFWVKFYLDNLDYVNNWDLVDVSAPKILGDYLLFYATPKEKQDIFDSLVESGHLWRQRVALISTMSFIKSRDYTYTLEFCKKLLKHDHDLIHKAMGWMLREIYQKDPTVTLSFLREYYAQTPRTTLRYALEKLPPAQRKAALSGDFTRLIL